MKDLGEENAGLKTELHRTKEALKAGHQSRGGDKTVELESLVRGMEDEKQQLQVMRGVAPEQGVWLGVRSWISVVTTLCSECVYAALSPLLSSLCKDSVMRTPD